MVHLLCVSCKTKKAWGSLVRLGRLCKLKTGRGHTFFELAYIYIFPLFSCSAPVNGVMEIGWLLGCLVLMWQSCLYNKYIKDCVFKACRIPSSNSEETVTVL